MPEQIEAIYIIKQTYGRRKKGFDAGDSYVFWAYTLDKAFEYVEKIMVSDNLLNVSDWRKGYGSHDYHCEFVDASTNFVGQFHISLLSEGI